MRLFIPLFEISKNDKKITGSKAYNLCRMKREGLDVPPGISITTDAYKSFVNSSLLKEWIPMELSRKKFEDMRWEEIWDTALRIRNKFLTTPIPENLLDALRSIIDGHFINKAVAIRSSAIDEDTSGVSFAGLHESYINIRGVDEILKHIKLVWASLWSDAALLYRKEFNLTVKESAMAVVIQELIEGEKSGVAFSKNPNDESQTIIEGVYGLNQGMVDGTIEPDRWLLERESGKIISYRAALKSMWIRAGKNIVRKAELPLQLKKLPVLTSPEVKDVFHLTQKAESVFRKPQDVEWTFKTLKLYCLQSRPITTTPEADAHGEDKRPWYLTLRRSFDNLKVMRDRIEIELIPAMIKTAEELAAIKLDSLSPNELADEIKRREEIHNNWVKIYWDEYIPFAHGVRLFGEIYNNRVKPEDPYEFMQLLSDTPMVSMDRNTRMRELANIVRQDTDFLQNTLFREKLNNFLDEYGFMICRGLECTRGRDTLIKILVKMAEKPEPEKKALKADNLRKNYLSCFDESEKDYALEILDLARASYRLRDDDNIHLGRIEGHLRNAVSLGNERIGKTRYISPENTDVDEIIRSLRDKDYIPKEKPVKIVEKSSFKISARQIKGQPAGPGVARGKARVIKTPQDLMEFKSGEILVCDAIDPNMTFIVPLSSGIVERRGGMLIHGAIIAREYGIPCVTGIPDATKFIATGDKVTVDGYLGIVIIG